MGVNLANDDAAARRCAERCNAAAPDAGAPRRWSPARARRRATSRDQPGRPPRASSASAQAADAADGRDRPSRNAVRRASRRGTHAGRRARGDARARRRPARSSACRELRRRCAARRPARRLPDGVAEVREAVDFLRYYAGEARTHVRRAAAAARPDRRGQPAAAARPRRVRVRSRPWNFPLAIFTGQVAAALAAGNSVIAKPAEQTNADRGARGRSCCTRPACPTTCCSSCPATARRSARRCAAIRASRASRSPARPTPRARSTARSPRATRRSRTLIAETGGQNAMIVDSPRRCPSRWCKRRAVVSAFTVRRPALLGRCACCSCRSDIADEVIEHAGRRMAELVVGDPACCRPTSAR